MEAVLAVKLNVDSREKQTSTTPNRKFCKCLFIAAGIINKRLLANGIEERPDTLLTAEDILEIRTAMRNRVEKVSPIFRPFHELVISVAGLTLIANYEALSIRNPEFPSLRKIIPRVRESIPFSLSSYEDCQCDCGQRVPVPIKN